MVPGHAQVSDTEQGTAKPQLPETFTVPPVQKPAFVLNPIYVLSTSDFFKKPFPCKKPAAVKTL